MTTILKDDELRLKLDDLSLSPEQQAEREREEFIEALSGAISLRARDGAKQVCEEVYDWLIDTGRLTKGGE